MDELEDFILSEMSEKIRQIPNDLTYMQNLKTKQKQINKKIKFISTENKQAVARRSGQRAGEMGAGGQRYKLPVMK